MPYLELKEWVALLKDFLLGLAAIVTVIVGVYGMRAWKRDLVGKEVYTATRCLVKESHLVCKAANDLRQPLWAYEKRQFTDEEISNTTKNERWRISEAEGYKKKVEIFAEKLKQFESAKLDLRVLVGSKVYEGFLPFSRSILESMERVNVYLELLQSYSNTYFPDSPEIIEAQNNLYPSENFDDNLSQSLFDSREEGEISLLSHLHRKTIYD
ncbi:hypothetical protein ACBI01_002435 [Aeromonas veronii]